MELWFNDFQNSTTTTTSLLVILEIIPGGNHAWPAWMSPTGHSSQQSMETADSWSQGVCWSPCLLGAGSVKLGCLAQIPASWGPSVMEYWCHMATLTWVNIGSDNGFRFLMPDVIKPLPEIPLTYRQRCCVAFSREQFVRHAHALNP